MLHGHGWTGKTTWKQCTTKRTWKHYVLDSWQHTFLYLQLWPWWPRSHQSLGHSPSWTYTRSGFGSSGLCPLALALTLARIGMPHCASPTHGGQQGGPTCSCCLAAILVPLALAMGVVPSLWPLAAGACNSIWYWKQMSANGNVSSLAYHQPWALVQPQQGYCPQWQTSIVKKLAWITWVIRIWLRGLSIYIYT